MDTKAQSSNFEVLLNLSELKVYNNISLSDIGEIEPNGSELFNRISGIVSQEKVDLDYWILYKGQDQFRYELTPRNEDGWDIAALTLKQQGSTLTVQNVSFSIGDNISKLNMLYPEAYNKRGFHPRLKTYCALINIPNLTGGITIYYNNQNGIINKIEFEQLLH